MEFKEYLKDPLYPSSEEQEGVEKIIRLEKVKGVSLERVHPEADDIATALQYMLTRAKQAQLAGAELSKFWVHTLRNSIGASFTYEGEEYNSYYVLDSHRGKGVFGEILRNWSKPILTMKECKLAPYLVKKHPHIKLKELSIPILESKEYKAIEEYYGNSRAKRSGVLLMNHIDEGLRVLTDLRSSEEAKRAFCIHPILQPDEVVGENIWLCERWDPVVVALAMEYRNKANKFLCRPENDYILTSSNPLRELEKKVGHIIPDVVDMLLADKIQNRKDFRLYHKGKHERSEQLSAYFDIWVEFLLYLKYNKRGSNVQN